MRTLMSACISFFIMRLRSTATCGHLDSRLARQLVLTALHLLNACSEVERLYLTLVAFYKRTHLSAEQLFLLVAPRRAEQVDGMCALRSRQRGGLALVFIYIFIHSPARASPLDRSRWDPVLPQKIHTRYDSETMDERHNVSGDVVWVWKIAGDCRNISACSRVIFL